MTLYIGDSPMTKPMQWNGEIPFNRLSEQEKRFRMLGTPIRPAVMPQRITDVYRLSVAEQKRLRLRGIPRAAKVIEVTDSNGTVKIAVDGNGKVVDAEKKGLTPLQMGMIAVGGFLLFGG